MGRHKLVIQVCSSGGGVRVAIQNVIKGMGRLFVTKILTRMSGFYVIQRLLQQNVLVSQFLMGIGTVRGPDASGEKVAFRLLQDRCTPPFCVFDVGANKGQYLNLVLKLIHSDDFHIHCFEPSHTTFGYLVANLKEDVRIKLNNIGLGKERCEALLYYDNPGSGLACLTKRRLNHFNKDLNKSEKVRLDTIDNYCRENAITRIHLLKMDVEGHELDVLAGAQEMLTKKLIDIVTFEFGGANIDNRSFFQDYWYLFQDIGMRIFRITPSGYLYAIKYYSEDLELFRTTNFLATANCE